MYSNFGDFILQQVGAEKRNINLFECRWNDEMENNLAKITIIFIEVLGRWKDPPPQFHKQTYAKFLFKNVEHGNKYPILLLGIHFTDIFEISTWKMKIRAKF